MGLKSVTTFLCSRIFTQQPFLIQLLMWAKWEKTREMGNILLKFEASSDCFQCLPLWLINELLNIKITIIGYTEDILLNCER